MLVGGMGFAWARRVRFRKGSSATGLERSPQVPCPTVACVRKAVAPSRLRPTTPNRWRPWMRSSHPARGATRCPRSDGPAKVHVGKAVPYGIYDRGQNRGWVSVGQDHGTASFAVETVPRRWRTEGLATYPEAHALLTNADSGGSNGSSTGYGFGNTNSLGLQRRRD